ncbi:MAG: dihydropteroate synthase [Gemmatimonadales bacterium]|jgi:dihydropteroate synthase
MTRERTVEGGFATGWRTARRTLSLERPVVMGVLNITPDSFSDGGHFFGQDKALRRLEEMQTEGADIVDVGGESTRPGSDPVNGEEELRRVLPAIEAAAARLELPVSVDTTKSRVARAALDAGAEIINDISGLRFDPELAELAAASGAGLVLMHIRGEPRTMQRHVHYDDLVAEIVGELSESTERALGAGCRREQLVVDPGIGFGKTAEHNLAIINELDRVGELGYPVLIGPSRKSFIGKTLGLEVGERLEATIAACVVGLLRGARIFRVHDIREARRALDMAEAIVRGSSGAEPD